MDRNQIIAKYASEMKGIVADAAVVNRKGGDLSLWLENAFRKIEARIGMIVDDALGVLPPPKPEQPKPVSNGMQQQRKVT